MLNTVIWKIKYSYTADNQSTRILVICQIRLLKYKLPYSTANQCIRMLNFMFNNRIYYTARICYLFLKENFYKTFLYLFFADYNPTLNIFLYIISVTPFLSIFICYFLHVYFDIFKTCIVNYLKQLFF